MYELRQSLEVSLARNVIGKLTPEHVRRLDENIRICEAANAAQDEAGCRIPADRPGRPCLRDPGRGGRAGGAEAMRAARHGQRPRPRCRTRRR
ncbi:FCD domain-containing protein [Paracoccus sp. APAP_BH8]|uniref:FCD domain-containing protein n=1 Tax=Paracoccus sp. APAP_BH8 TaxID=3110237 RepID=UPI003FA72BED